MVHALNKGKTGEREIVTLLNKVLSELVAENSYPQDVVEMLQNVAQRNQNQSAVGGGDVNLFGVSIEVKRQEALQVDKWWQQCTTSASRNKDIPVLIFRQNRLKWRVVMPGALILDKSAYMHTRIETDIDSFKQWFKRIVFEKLQDGYSQRV